MVGIMFHYEENNSDVRYSLWDEFLAVWGFDILIMIDKDNLYSPKAKRRKKHTYDSIEDAMPNYDATYIALAPHGDTSLKDFVHPTDSIIYVIGANSWIDSQLPDGITKIKIDTPTDSMSVPMTDISAATCLAYDRRCKLG